MRFDNLGLGQSEGDWGDGSFSPQGERHRPVPWVLEPLRAGRFAFSSGIRSAAPPLLRPRITAHRGSRGQCRRAVRPAHGAQFDAWSRESRPTAKRPSSWEAGADLKRHFIEDGARRGSDRTDSDDLAPTAWSCRSPTDNTVGIANASEIFRTARHPRSFVSLEGADHPPHRQNQPPGRSDPSARG